MATLHLLYARILWLMFCLHMSVQQKRKFQYNALMTMVGSPKHLARLSSIMIIGLEHQLLFITCSCELLSVTLARAELWPATPTNPRYAFSFTLLDWAEALLLESQVALKDFCKSLSFRCPFHLLKVFTLILSFYCNTMLLYIEA